MGARRPAAGRLALRGALRLLRAVLHGVRGLAIVLLVFPHLGRAQRERRIAWWSQGMLAALGVRLQVEGAPRPGAKLIACNHVSWLDIMAVHASCPQARFVSKADVRHWPLVHRLVDSARTLYLERERKRDALRVVHVMAQALSDGDTVAVFPEGTTGEGPSLLPFHANLLQAAIATQTPVQPVALRYADARSRFSPAAEFVGDTSLVQSLWRIACGDGVVVHVRWLAPQGTRHADRRALAAALQASVQEALDEGEAACAPALARA